ncbi:ankyrin repeat domain-containing protein [Flavobacterium supellecticarium]|uniref:Ankyrin repeat domain-containing protein n=1 Tax=Flavobacterium supellecticarium TaxID=2565924 RepID=A0A4S4A4H2_9FLAO|nr:ankyrin repeat domain-containing protein [Flavobacterium supellecticarium]THF52855.1 ankyrin repeat domain-containing protein [Flavobacterium supellecticarium]
MEIELQRQLKSAIRAEKDSNVVIKMLDDYPTEINLVDGTPLNHAVSRNRIEIINYLIQRNANVNALYDKNYSPLMSAIDGKNLETATLLLKNGADIHLKDKYGNDALWKAVNTNDLEFIKLIIEAGANPFIGDNPENYSAYDSAKDMGADEIVAYFDSLK